MKATLSGWDGRSRRTGKDVYHLEDGTKFLRSLQAHGEGRFRRKYRRCSFWVAPGARGRTFSEDVICRMYIGRSRRTGKDVYYYTRLHARAWSLQAHGEGRIDFYFNAFNIEVAPGARGRTAAIQKRGCRLIGRSRRTGKDDWPSCSFEMRRWSLQAHGEGRRSSR